MTQPQIPQSIFPDYPREVPAIEMDADGTRGHFTALWDLGLGALFQALQENFKNEGIVFPELLASQLATIQALYASYIGGTYAALVTALPDISGQTIYVSDQFTPSQFVIGIDGSTPPNVTLAQWVPFAMMTTYAGNPNSNVAGILNWLCYDSTDVQLYICTTAGNATNAVWSAI